MTLSGLVRQVVSQIGMRLHLEVFPLRNHLANLLEVQRDRVPRRRSIHRAQSFFLQGTDRSLQDRFVMADLLHPHYSGYEQRRLQFRDLVLQQYIFWIEILLNMEY